MGSIPWIMMMKYECLPQLLLRAPYYSYLLYDPDRLSDVLEKNVFRLAISLASPDFYALLVKKNFTFHALSVRERLTLLKYYNRMCYRATPFGCFASFSISSWTGPVHTVQLTDGSAAELSLLPDWGRREAAWGEPVQTVVGLNPLLYKMGGLWRYLSYDPQQRRPYQYRINELEAGRLNNDMIRMLKKAGKSRLDLLNWISKRTGCSEEEAAEYLNFLKEEQVIYYKHPVSLIAPGDFRTSTWSIQVAADRLAHDPAAEGGMLYSALHRPVQEGYPDSNDQTELREVINFLTIASSSGVPHRLKTFAQQMHQRYGGQRVPLLSALDPDMGFSYGGLSVEPASENVTRFSIGNTAETERNADEFSQLKSLFLRRLAERRHSAEPVTFTKSDLADFNTTFDPVLPPTLAAVYSRTNSGLTLEMVSGACANQIAGRFNLFHEGIYKLTKGLAHVEEQANAGVVFADISHYSDDHADNINRRRQTYTYEIALNGNSALPCAQVIEPGDLFISVQQGDIILESKRLEKRVVPRLSSAYFYKRSNLAIYNFLCDLQHQGMRRLLLPDFPALIPGLKYYPRVVYEHTIISPATWQFESSDLEGLVSGDLPARLKQLQNLREANQLPDYVSVGTADERLVYDLSRAAERIFLLDCLKPGRAANFQEYLLPDRSIKNGHEPHGGHFVAFFHHRDRVYAAAKNKGSFKTIPAVHLPGSEWLYVKIYCSPHSADLLLDQLIRWVILRYQKRVRTWFFIRYQDPDHHIRLRIRVNEGDVGQLLVALQTRIRTTKLKVVVQNLVVDSYRPELERYPPEYLEIIEEIFMQGSDLMLNTYSATKPDPFQLAFRSMQLMLSVIYPDASDQLQLAERVWCQLYKEFGGSKMLRVELDQQVRSDRSVIEAIPELDSLSGLANALDRLARQTSNLGVDRKEKLWIDLIHMQMNRTFETSQRAQELRTWYSLYKYLSSKKRRNS